MSSVHEVEGCMERRWQQETVNTMGRLRATDGPRCRNRKMPGQPGGTHRHAMSGVNEEAIRKIADDFAGQGVPDVSKNFLAVR